MAGNDVWTRALPHALGPLTDAMLRATPPDVGLSVALAPAPAPRLDTQPDAQSTARMASVKPEDLDIEEVVVVMTATSIRPTEPVHKDRPSSWGKALGWIALAAVVILALVVAAAGINVKWFNGRPGYGTSGAGFNLNIVPLKHPVPDAGFYCAGISWFSGALPNPQLVAAEVNAAPNAAAHGAALKFYNDLVHRRSTTDDLATVDTTYACPNGG